MPSTPVPPAAIDATTPTSRSTFRLLVKTLGATNREADGLRHRLLAATDSAVLTARLRSLDVDDPDGALGVEPRLGIWFEDVESAGDRMVAAGDPVLEGLSPELAARLSAIDLGGMHDRPTEG